MGANTYMDLHNRIPAKRGTISFMHQDASLSVVFMYNPGEVVRSHGFSHGKEAIPGRSHPMYGGGAGDEESFNFTLQLDADRGNYELRMQRNPRANDFTVFDELMQVDGLLGGPQPEQLENLRPLLNQFFQLVSPDGLQGQPEGAYGVPARIFIDLGAVLKGEIGVDNLQEGIFHYGPSHNVLKATLQMKGHVIEHSNVSNTVLMERTIEYVTESDRVRTEQLNRVAANYEG